MHVDLRRNSCSSLLPPCESAPSLLLTLFGSSQRRPHLREHLFKSGCRCTPPKADPQPHLYFARPLGHEPNCLNASWQSSPPAGWRLPERVFAERGSPVRTKSFQSLAQPLLRPGAPPKPGRSLVGPGPVLKKLASQRSPEALEPISPTSPIAASPALASLPTLFPSLAIR